MFRPFKQFISFRIKKEIRQLAANTVDIGLSEPFDRVLKLR